MRKPLAAIAAIAITSAVGIGAALAAPSPKVTICHGTASATNPYVVITVSASSFKNGHFDDQVDKSHGVNNHPDFVLTEGRTCADGPDGTTTTTEAGSTTTEDTTTTQGGSTTTEGTTTTQGTTTGDSTTGDSTTGTSTDTDGPGPGCVELMQGFTDPPATTCEPGSPGSGTCILLAVATC